MLPAKPKRHQLGAGTPVTFAYDDHFDGSLKGQLNAAREQVQDKFLSLLLFQRDIEAARGQPLDDVANVWTQPARSCRLSRKRELTGGFLPAGVASTRMPHEHADP